MCITQVLSNCLPCSSIMRKMLVTQYWLKMITCFTETLWVGADAKSTTHGLTKTGNKKYLVQDERYLDTVYADNLDIDVKRSNGHIDSLKVALCNAPDTWLQEITQHRCSNHIRIVSQLYKTTKAVKFDTVQLAASKLHNCSAVCQMQ